MPGFYGKVRRFVSSSSVFSLPWFVRSSDVIAGPQPPLHHGRHLNQFPLLASYSTFTAAQVFNTDQSLLLTPSFITASFLLFSSFLHIPSHSGAQPPDSISLFPVQLMLLTSSSSFPQNQTSLFISASLLPPPCPALSHSPFFSLHAHFLFHYLL